MAVWAVAPARDPARNRLCVWIFWPSDDNNLLYYRKHKKWLQKYLMYEHFDEYHQLWKKRVRFKSFWSLTCSYAMNLIAVSGAIFKTLIPFPLHSDVRPPSEIICLKPPTRLMQLVLEEWTYRSQTYIRLAEHLVPKIKIHSLIYIYISHLHENFHPVQRSSSGAGDGPRHCTCKKLLPPDAWGLLLLCEFVWDSKTVTYVQHLVITGTNLFKPLSFMDTSRHSLVCQLMNTMKVSFLGGCTRHKHFSFWGLFWQRCSNTFSILAILLAVHWREGNFYKTLNQRFQVRWHIGRKTCSWGPGSKERWNPAGRVYSNKTMTRAPCPLATWEIIIAEPIEPLSCMLQVFQINMPNVFPKA